MSIKNDNYLECIEIETAPTIHSSIIWLHGLGADGNDFVPIVSELHIPTHLGLRFIFPHAPMQSITINNGYVMRAWYDILGFSRESVIDYPGIARSVEKIFALIEREISRGIKSEKIIIGGFSQGAVMALTCGLNYPQPLAGIIALSGYLPFTADALKVHHNIPVFLGHGVSDEIVSYQLGEMALKTLQEKKLPITFKSYPVGHTVCPHEIDDIHGWIISLLAK